MDVIKLTNILCVLFQHWLDLSKKMNKQMKGTYYTRIVKIIILTLIIMMIKIIITITTMIKISAAESYRFRP